MLYLSYDGMTDPLGRSQVLPYLTGLARRGHDITLVSLDKPALYARHRETVDQICRYAGITWHSLPYRHRLSLVSALGNIAALRRLAGRLQRARGYSFIHARSDLAGLAALALQRRQRVPFVYDMRAFWPDERAEGGAGDQSKRLYRMIFTYFKARQRDLLNAADEIVVLSEAGRNAVRAMPDYHNAAPVTVIPCCADFDAFNLPQAVDRERYRSDLALAADDRLIIHLGSIGCNCLLDEMLDFFVIYCQFYPGARLLFLTPDDDGTISRSAQARGVGNHVDVRSATREDVPGWIGAADLGLFFVRPVFSKKAASPTKLGEMLAVGLPVITNGGVGDVAEIVADVAAGVVIEQFDEPAYYEAIDKLEALTIDPQRIRASSLPWFDVQMGIDRYDAIYRRLAGLAGSAPNRNGEMLSA